MPNWQSLCFDSTRTDLPISSNLVNQPTGQTPKQVVDFLTLQSLSFPVVAGLVSLSWKVVQALVGEGDNWGDSRFVPLGLSALVVYGFFFGQWVALGNAWARLGALMIGFLNALLLTGSALGIVELAADVLSGS